MKVSIREDQCNGRARLMVYRPRERAYSLPGNAYETKSGFWIVTVLGEPPDVAYHKREATNRLLAYYEAQP